MIRRRCLLILAVGFLIAPGCSRHKEIVRPAPEAAANDEPKPQRIANEEPQAVRNWSGGDD